MRVVGAFFGDIVEVANELRARSQMASGAIGMDRADLAAELRAKRNAKVFEVGCSLPENAGREQLSMSPACIHRLIVSG
ncbi:MAG: hypothetical protein WA679_19585 [Pseudolabrys sp.]